MITGAVPILSALPKVGALLRNRVVNDCGGRRGGNGTANLSLRGADGDVA